ncbi:MAG: hypothetical protein PHH28_02285 [Desulfuromonadaceae bacterium]|nr:hypothetical protein [Desulfuromonadaceae bacterium]
MPNVADDLDKLLSEVRKTISDNKQFLEKLLDETVEDDAGNEAETIPIDEEFEEL